MVFYIIIYSKHQVIKPAAYLVVALILSTKEVHYAVALEVHDRACGIAWSHF